MSGPPPRELGWRQPFERRVRAVFVVVDPPVLVEDLLGLLDDKGPVRSDIAGNAVRAFVAAAAPMYEAAVQSLSESETSLAAVGLMRTPIETWSHLDFIGVDEGSDCRALRVVLGAQLQADGALRATT